jgi:hypothetical protein
MKKFNNLYSIILAIAAITAVTSAAGLYKFSAKGKGALSARSAKNGRIDKREFSFNAQVEHDGTVSGNAVLVNPEFEGADVSEPFQLEMDISCVNVVGDVAFFGGTAQRTTDPNLVDAAYFSIQDDDATGVRKISQVHFFDDDPNTTGDPQLCMGNRPGDFPMEPIESGDIDIRK